MLLDMKMCLNMDRFLGVKKFPTIGNEAKHDAIAQESSFRDKYEQTPFVLEGEGASLVVQRSSSRETEQVYCRVSLRFSTWGQVRASTGTLVGQPPYLVRRGLGEVVPVGSSLLVVRLMLVSE